MKKFINIAKGFFKKGEIIKNTVDGIEKIGKVKVSKKKIALLKEEGIVVKNNKILDFKKLELK